MADGTVVQYAIPVSNVARMTSISDRNGNTMQYQYNGSNQLIRVVDTLGRNIDYLYNLQGRLAEVKDYSRPLRPLPLRRGLQPRSQCSAAHRVWHTKRKQLPQRPVHRLCLHLQAWSTQQEPRTHLDPGPPADHDDGPGRRNPYVRRQRPRRHPRRWWYKRQWRSGGWNGYYDYAPTAGCRRRSRRASPMPTATSPSTASTRRADIRDRRTYQPQHSAGRPGVIRLLVHLQLGRRSAEC